MTPRKKQPETSFFLRVYLCVLALFLVFFNATVLGVAWHSNDRAFVSQRDKLLTQQQSQPCHLLVPNSNTFLNFSESPFPHP